MPFSDPDERNACVDMVAQAVVDKIEERDRINGLADLVFQRVLALQQQQAALNGNLPSSIPAPEKENYHD